MRIGGLGPRIVVALVVLAVASCAKGMLMSDDGTLTGGSGANGTGGQAGAAGGGNASGAGGVQGCTAADVRTTCNVDVAYPPVAGTAGAPCSVEGAHCVGYSCNDSFSGYVWEATCCFGVWLNISGPCPALAGTRAGPR